MAATDTPPSPPSLRRARPSTVPGFTQGRLLAVLGSLFLAVFLASLGAAVRTLGGSLGNAGNGTVLNSTVRSSLPERLGISADAAGDLIRAPKQIRALPGGIRQAVVDTFATAVSRVYWVAAGAMAIAVV